MYISLAHNRWYSLTGRLADSLVIRLFQAQNCLLHVQMCRGDDVQMARTWRPDGTASTSRCRRCSITAWTNCWSASLARYDCGKRDPPPPPPPSNTARISLQVVGLTPARPPAAPSCRSPAVSSELPSPPSENCSDVAVPSRPRPATTCSRRDRLGQPRRYIRPPSHVHE